MVGENLSPSPQGEGERATRGKWASIAIIALAQVAALALWFSATAVVPALRASGQLSPLVQSMFTSAVQIGFVAGSLTSAILGLADRIDPRRLFAAAAVLGALANGAIAFADPASPLVLTLRFVTGATLAAIYPVGMKMAASWADRDVGLLVGLLVGALTLGSAAPHLFNAFGGAHWRVTLLAASATALIAAGIIHLAAIGPRFAQGAPFRRELILRAWSDKGLRLANFGYLGHMWELYAMWAWIGVFLAAAFQARLGDAGAAQRLASLATFAVLGSGALGCLAAGLLADRIGRTLVASGAMAISGTCALLVGLLFDAHPALLMAVAIIWGISVVADSAQFSASITELSDKGMVGTMLTLQTAMGFTLTLVTIHLMPTLFDSLGWRWGFAPLALGPAFGVWAMLRLRGRPESAYIAGGRR